MGPKRDYSQRLPTHYCGDCSQVVYLDDAVCPSCARAQNGGWPSLEDGFDMWLGRVLDGRYVVTRRVGRGAMGTVYRAESLAISRQFAVKIINVEDSGTGLDAAQVRARLNREIEAIGRLRNPHVVPFYEVLELFGHFVGIVMDYIDGTTLEDLVLREGPLEPRRALAILRQVANGVHEAHEVGMIHRDLKPDNVMVEKLPAGDDFAHVLDFGIVQLDDGVSMTKGFLGTPLYASPEQAMGAALDRRSDIYSLGALLFFTLTSHPPFESQNVYEILQAHVRRPAPTLASVFGRAFPAGVEELVASMLAKNPERRPQTLGAVISKIDQLLRTPVLDDHEPDSIEFAFDAGARAGRTITTLTGLNEESSSVFESEERDTTGPKAAIFKRGRSRGDERLAKNHNTNEFDRVYQGMTGATTLGLAVAGPLVRGACSAGGDLLLQSERGLHLYRGGKEQTLAVDAASTTALGLSAVAALTGSSDGHVFEITGGTRESLFQDVRRAPISAIAASNTDAVWLAGSASGRLYKCAPAAGRNVWIRVSDGAPVAALALDARATTFALARADGEVELAFVSTPRQPFARFRAVVDGVRCIALSDDGRLLAILGQDDTVCVHLADSGHVLHTARDAKHHMCTIGFVGDELLGYFELDGRLYARQLDRAFTPT